MFKRIDFEDCAGKTIKSVREPVDEVVFVFDDGTYVRLSASPNWSEGAFVEDGFNFKVYDAIENKWLVDDGFFTKEEVQACRDSREARELEASRMARHEQYLKLKAEFEPSPSPQRVSECFADARSFSPPSE